ncbi:MAG: hypothetical protein HQM09_23030 [Candidatus Riflebacteria bacterium]|nr:hypothetical protein [Candidatus Riflebacteria bacterium]
MRSGLVRSNSSLMPLAHFLSCLALLATVFMSGCNTLSGIDTTIEQRTDGEKLREAELALERADYPLSLELFNNLVAAGKADGPALRGQGESMAGIAGFRFLAAMDALQNGTGAYDHSPVTFRLLAVAGSREALDDAVIRLMRAPDPARSDRLTRALIRLTAIVKLLIEKYDTNHNHRLDEFDAIDYTTNDKTTPTWKDIERECLSGPSTTTGETLENVFVDLFNGFDGRGEKWTFITPILGETLSGTFSNSNRDTVLAVGDLANRLQKAQSAYGVNVASFAAAIRDLDGAE